MLKKGLLSAFSLSAVMAFYFLGDMIATSTPIPSHDIEEKLASCESNKFGAHVMFQDYDVAPMSAHLDKVYELTGSCGYVKGFDPFVKPDPARWGKFVAEARKRNLLPVLRLGHGKIPSADDSARYASYIDSINKFADQQYPGAKIHLVELWNEPNLAVEWNGNPNPEEYARFLYSTALAVKQLNKEVLVMNGALALTDGTQNDLETFAFIERMFAAEPMLVSALDLWSSHPYPQDFAHCSPGGGYAEPKYCFNGYEAELNVLKKFYDAAQKELPRVFISETSWRTSAIIDKIEGSWWEGKRPSMYSPQEFCLAWKTYWLPDDRVIGVTPFQFVTLNPLWRDFSMLDPDTLESTSYFNELKKLRQETRND